MITIAYDQNIIEADNYLGHLGTLLPFDGRSLTSATLPECDALLVRSVTHVNESLLLDSHISFVGTATAGIDHIDTEYLQKKGMYFTSAAGSNAISVAEYVCAALYHLDCITTERVPKVAIIGYGHVGKEVERMLQAIGCSTVLYDPPLFEQTGDSRLNSIDNLFDADILTIHTPLTTAQESKHPTKGMVDEAFLRNFKQGLTLINSARGGVVNEKDLKKLHGEGFFSHVILDVFENEPLPDKEILQLCSLHTPHIAGYSYTGKLRGTIMMKDALIKHYTLPENKQEQKKQNQLQPLVYSTSSVHEFLKKALLTVYPIYEDHVRTQILLNSSDRATDFDRLRKSYPQRFECSDYTITGDIPEDTAQRLTRLGFHIAP